jgi:hypothetical protein
MFSASPSQLPELNFHSSSLLHAGQQDQRQKHGFVGAGMFLAIREFEF